MWDRLWQQSPLLILLFGASLFVLAIGHHTRELLVLGDSTAPLAALLLDGLPAVALAAGGYWLYGTDLSAPCRRTVFLWCLGGAAIFTAVIGATFVIRVLEGRPLVEPVFVLLTAVDTGAIAGLVTGYYNAHARSEARRARTASEALMFVNGLIRHDLRNDLNVIRGHADLASNGETGTGLDSTAVIGEKADEALMRIETTRAVADMLSGTPDLEPVDLAEITADLAAQVERTFGVTVTTELPDCAPVRANAGLRSLVDNLLENAVEHNDADEPRVAVAVEREAEAVRLTVRDNGPGLPDDVKESLRAPVRTVREGGGLALVRTLVDGLDGDVRVEDNEPRGTVVTVTLPQADHTPDDDAAAVG
jgi:signal transduction histidine kinase